MVCVKFAKTTTLQKVIRKRRVSKFVIYICQWSWRFNAFFLFRILGLILMFLVYTDLMLHISPLYIIIHFIKGIQIVSNCNLAECQPFLVPKTSIKKVLLRIIIDKLPLQQCYFKVFYSQLTTKYGPQGFPLKNDKKLSLERERIYYLTPTQSKVSQVSYAQEMSKMNLVLIIQVPFFYAIVHYQYVQLK